MADTPDYQSSDYATLRTAWHKVDTLLAGTRGLRALGEEFLPQYPAEADDVYEDRLQTSTFDNDYEDTLDGVVGMIFRRPVQLGESVPLLIKAALENVDLKGANFSVFAPRFVRKGVHYGAAYILVDMQRRPESLDGETIDQATADSLNLRPYWIGYGAKDVQSRPRYVAIRGALTLQQIVFKECAIEPDGDYGDKEVTRYRVWRLPVEPSGVGQYTEAGFVEWQVWQEVEDSDGPKKDRRPSVILTDSGVTTLSRIPVAPFIANPDPNDETLCAGPTLEDLADLCIKDWQQQSDFEGNLHYCVPVPFTAGLKDDGAKTQFAFGKGIMFDLEQGGQMGFAEPSGNAFPTWQTYLDKLKEKIRQKGLEMVLEGGAPNTTATEQILRAGKRASRLAMITVAAQDCFETALQHTAAWLGLGEDAGGEATMGVKGDELIITSADVQALTAAVDGNKISLRTYWAILMRGGLLSDDFDVEKELDDIAEERGWMFDQSLDEHVQRQEVAPVEPMAQPAGVAR